MRLQSEAPKWPEEDPLPEGRPPEVFPVGWAITGFVMAPLILGLTLPFRSPVPACILLVACLGLLFSNRHRPFGLGFLQFCGVAVLLFLAICGRAF